MKRFLGLIILSIGIFILIGCRAKTYEIALITDVGTIDDKSFNQGSWEGVKQYAEEFNISHKYYKPRAKSTQDYLNAIDLAIKGGAKVVVTPGYLFEPAVYEAQDKYPDVTFILIDGIPNNKVFDDSGKLISGEERIEDNVYPILYAEEESGFLAGYASVKEGFTKLGFMGGMAVPAVVKFGYGFIQGAEYAARELNLPNDAITLRYHYLGDFQASPEFQTMAASWYSDGLEIIFVAAGGAGNSVMKAAEAGTNPDTDTYKYVIGVDVDQSNESDTVIISAVKMLANSVYQCLSVIYDNESEYKEYFTKGKTTILDATSDGIGLLPTNFNRFPNKTFTLVDYNTIFDRLSNDEIALTTTIKGKDVTFKSYLGLQKVNVTEIA